jgi:hypothetical protein
MASHWGPGKVDIVGTALHTSQTQAENRVLPELRKQVSPQTTATISPQLVEYILVLADDCP